MLALGQGEGERQAGGSESPQDPGLSWPCPSPSWCWETPRWPPPSALPNAPDACPRMGEWCRPPKGRFMHTCPPGKRPEPPSMARESLSCMYIFLTTPPPHFVLEKVFELSGHNPFFVRFTFRGAGCVRCGQAALAVPQVGGKCLQGWRFPGAFPD